MSFSFGFSGDDVDDEDDVVGQDGQQAKSQHTPKTESQFVGLPAQEHSIDELVGFQ